jgi:hypothetical protein
VSISSDGATQLKYFINGMSETDYFLQSLVSDSDAYAYLYRSGNDINIVKLNWEEINTINDKDFANYIIDKYL